MSNHIANVGRIYLNKPNLIALIKGHSRDIKRRYNLEVSDFLPESYRIDLLADLKSFLESPTMGKWVKRPINKLKGQKQKNIVSKVYSLRRKYFEQNEKQFYDFYGKEGYFKEYNSRLL